ncbi:hypothetical protein SLEP1_g22474 [Rubroshorea leprosula]|uniref:Uncharacterized protein n=1 Tax=Rubroshorea leprosula TaxID=152421 RepID=A0AAV5JFD6_9ROSI|nr:hypothetical protein SLEP1_g22474 [Rubroshorea leprosula]
MRVVRSGGAGSLRRGVLVQTNDQMRVCLLWLSYTHGEVPSFLTGFSKWRVVEFGLEAGSFFCLVGGSLDKPLEASQKPHFAFSCLPLPPTSFSFSFLHQG